MGGYAPNYVYRSKELFKISPVDTQRMFDDETMKQIEELRKQTARGEVTVCKTKKEILKHLESL